MEQNDAFLTYILASVSPEHHEAVIQSHQRIGNAAMALYDAHNEYMEAIIERIQLNERIRRGTVPPTQTI